MELLVKNKLIDYQNYEPKEECFCDICFEKFQNFKMSVCICKQNICFDCVKKIFMTKFYYVCPFCNTGIYFFNINFMQKYMVDEYNEIITISLLSNGED